MSVDFSDAFDRWKRIADAEHKYLTGQRSANNVVAWEALDHVAGLAAESKLKHLLVQKRWIRPQPDGDLPPSSNGRRPHLDELLTQLPALVPAGRASATFLSALQKESTPLTNWRSADRYARDGTLTETVTIARYNALKKLVHAVDQELP